MGGGGAGGAIFFQEQSLEMVKLTKMPAFEIVLPKNFARSWEFKQESRTASYNQMESTLPMTSYDILKTEKGVKINHMQF